MKRVGAASSKALELDMRRSLTVMCVCVFTPSELQRLYRRVLIVPLSEGTSRPDPRVHTLNVIQAAVHVCLRHLTLWSLHTPFTDSRVWATQLLLESTGARCGDALQFS